MDILASYGLTQYVQGATHDAGGTLDIVCTRSDLPPPNVDVLDFRLSDHRLLRWSTQTSRSAPVFITSIRRCWRSFDQDTFRTDLLASARSATLKSSLTWTATPSRRCTTPLSVSCWTDRCRYDPCQVVNAIIQVVRRRLPYSEAEVAFSGESSSPRRSTLSLYINDCRFVARRASCVLRSSSSKTTRVLNRTRRRRPVSSVPPLAVFRRTTGPWSAATSRHQCHGHPSLSR